MNRGLLVVGEAIGLFLVLRGGVRGKRPLDRISVGGGGSLSRSSMVISRICRVAVIIPPLCSRLNTIACSMPEDILLMYNRRESGIRNPVFGSRRKRFGHLYINILGSFFTSSKGKLY